MKTIRLHLMLVAAICFAMACNNSGNDSKDRAEEANEERLEGEMEDAADFAVSAAADGMLEVQLGKLAQTKAQNPEVKEFANMMVTGHTDANEKLKSIAQQKNITLPATLGDKEQDKMEKLQEKSGEKFDKEYIDFMVKDHKKAIRKFERQADNGDDPEIKSFASSVLPELKNHLQMAERIQENINGDNGMMNGNNNNNTGKRQNPNTNTNDGTVYPDNMKAK